MKRASWLYMFPVLTIPASAQAAETATYEYDALGRLVKTTKSGGPASGTQKTTDYDPAGNRTSKTTTGAPPPPPPSS
ncbi:MAG: RHS repeat domain-containing protein [Sphingorhabdus sp.]